MTKKPRTNVNGLPALLFWGLVWQAGAMILGNPLLLPTPVQVVQRLLDLTVTAVAVHDVQHEYQQGHRCFCRRQPVLALQQRRSTEGCHHKATVS